MEIINQKVKSKATGVEATIAGVEKGKVLINIGFGKPIPCSIDSLIMEDELKEAILNEINKTNRKKVKTGVFGEFDSRRAPELIKDPLTIKELHKGDCLGTVGKDIYESLCKNENFNWDISKSGNFGMMQRMYTDNATKEGYAVWMLTHSSYDGSVSKSERVINHILENSDVIEHWSEEYEMAEYNPSEIRVTFVRNSCGQYIFWGLLANDTVNKETREVLHKYIRKEYK